MSEIAKPKIARRVDAVFSPMTGSALGVIAWIATSAPLLGGLLLVVAAAVGWTFFGRTASYLILSVTSRPRRPPIVQSRADEAQVHLSSLRLQFPSAQCNQVFENVLAVILDNRAEFERSFKTYPHSTRNWVLAAVANTAGDLAASGKLHVYRGLLAPGAEQLLALFDYCLWEQCHFKVVERDWAKKQRRGLRRQIAEQG
jgi:hypothetical protein